jgi:hypothetical protein
MPASPNSRSEPAKQNVRALLTRAQVQICMETLRVTRKDFRETQPDAFRTRYGYKPRTSVASATRPTERI